MDFMFIKISDHPLLISDSQSNLRKCRNQCTNLMLQSFGKLVDYVVGQCTQGYISEYIQPEQFGYLINQSVNLSIRHCGIVCL